MFGLFKKKVAPADFGEGIIALSKDWLLADAGRSLSSRFSDFDASSDGTAFLEKKGLPASKQNLYFRLYRHCAIQGACTQFDSSLRRAITNGAMSVYVKKMEGYDFDQTFMTLEASYNGQQKFERRIESLSNTATRLTISPSNYPNVAVSNSKFLLSSFIVPNMKNSKAFFEEFESFSSTVFSSIGTVCRAIDQVSKSYKI